MDYGNKRIVLMTGCIRYFLLLNISWYDKIRANKKYLSDQLRYLEIKNCCHAIFYYKYFIYLFVWNYYISKMNYSQAQKKALKIYIIYSFFFEVSSCQ